MWFSVILTDIYFHLFFLNIHPQVDNIKPKYPGANNSNFKIIKSVALIANDSLCGSSFFFTMGNSIG